MNKKNNAEIVEHFSMSEDNHGMSKNIMNRKKINKAKKKPRIDTEILRNRIAEKIANLNNY